MLPIRTVCWWDMFHSVTYEWSFIQSERQHHRSEVLAVNDSLTYTVWSHRRVQLEGVKHRVVVEGVDQQAFCCRRRK